MDPEIISSEALSILLYSGLSLTFQSQSQDYLTSHGPLILGFLSFLSSESYAHALCAKAPFIPSHKILSSLIESYCR